MPSLKEIKSRINSVNSTKKITSAMKMVASAKLHRAQAAITNMLPYEQKLHSMLTAFLSEETIIQSPYIEEHSLEKIALVVFSSNSSLCGAFNANVIRQMRSVINEYKSLGTQNILIYPIGRKIADACRKAGLTIQGNFQRLAEKPSYPEMAELAQSLMKQYVSHEIDRVEIIYHHMKSTASQILVRETYLPITLESEAETDSKTALDYIVEPSKEQLIATLLPQVLSLKLYTVLLDSNASEHAARMLAMQIATDNADDLIQDLTVLFNKSRQSAITNELLDIMGGSIR